MNKAITSITWLHPLWLFAALVFFLFACFWRYPGNKDHWHRVMSSSVLSFLGNTDRVLRRLNLVFIIATIICIALAKPALRQSSNETWRHSIGWVVVADVSRSMTLNDSVPSRLSAAREAMLSLSNAAGARPIAMILYAGDAFLVAPPAFDRSHFNEHAALLEHGIIPQEGSNLARALSLASSVIEESEYVRARVFVIGDSGGFNQNSEAAARHFASEGHRLDVIVFGSEADQSISSNIENNSQAPNNVAVDLTASHSLAKAGGGIVMHGNKFGVVNFKPLKLHRDSDASNASALESLVWRNQSHWLLLLALPLMLYWFHQNQEDNE